MTMICKNNLRGKNIQFALIFKYRFNKCESVDQSKLSSRAQKNTQHKKNMRANAYGLFVLCMICIEYSIKLIFGT